MFVIMTLVGAQFLIPIGVWNLIRVGVRDLSGTSKFNPRGSILNVVMNVSDMILPSFGNA